MIPQAGATKYLGIHLDRRLTWKTHIINKRKSLSIKLRTIYSLLERKSKLSLSNKVLIYNCILKPVWTYGLNLELLQRFQSKVLRMIAKAPWYITNRRIHHELRVPVVASVVHEQAARYRDRILAHPNPLASKLMSPSNDFESLIGKCQENFK